MDDEAGDVEPKSRIKQLSCTATESEKSICILEDSVSIKEAVKSVEENLTHKCRGIMDINTVVYTNISVPQA